MSLPKPSFSWRYVFLFFFLPSPVQRPAHSIAITNNVLPSVSAAPPCHSVRALACQLTLDENNNNNADDNNNQLLRRESDNGLSCGAATTNGQQKGSRRLDNLLTRTSEHLREGEATNSQQFMSIWACGPRILKML